MYDKTSPTKLKDIEIIELALNQLKDSVPDYVWIMVARSYFDAREAIDRIKNAD